MMRKKYGGFFMRKNIRTVIWTAMMMAFVAGILFINLSMDTYLEKDVFVLQRIAEKLESIGSDKRGYLYWLAKRRLGNYVILGLLGESVAGTVGLILYGLWFCFAEGICFTSIFSQSSVRGVWGMLLLQLPHMPCYILAYIQLIRKRIPQNLEKREHFRLEWLYCLPLIIAGIGIECFISPEVAGVIKKWFI